MPEDLKKLFQITEAARACSLSRSTLLRLEEKGLLTPAYTAPDSGRRYYDNHNVARILQIEKLKASMSGSYRANPKPFESYQLSNNNAAPRI